MLFGLQEDIAYEVVERLVGLTLDGDRYGTSWMTGESYDIGVTRLAGRLI